MLRPSLQTCTRRTRPDVLKRDRSRTRKVIEKQASQWSPSAASVTGQKENGGQGQNRTADTRIFSNLTYARPFASIGANRCESVCLAWSQGVDSDTFAHISTNGSDKVTSKVFEHSFERTSASSFHLNRSYFSPAQRIRNPLTALAGLSTQLLTARLVSTLLEGTHGKR